MRNQAAAMDSLGAGIQLLGAATEAWAAMEWGRCGALAVRANKELLTALELVQGPKACDFVIKQLTRCVSFQDNCELLQGGGDVWQEIDAFNLAVQFARALGIPIVLFRGVGESGWRVSTSLLPGVEEYEIVTPDTPSLEEIDDWDGEISE